MRDLASNIGPVDSVPPLTNRTASINGIGVSTKGFDSAAAVVHFGAITDGGWTPSIEESDTLGSGYTAVAAADQVGTFVEAVAANDLTTQKVSYVGIKEFIRIVVTESTASVTGANFSGMIVLGHPHVAPVA